MPGTVRVAACGEPYDEPLDRLNLVLRRSATTPQMTNGRAPGAEDGKPARQEVNRHRRAASTCSGDRAVPEVAHGLGLAVRQDRR